jgi:dienelactone hydrolase
MLNFLLKMKDAKCCPDDSYSKLIVDYKPNGKIEEYSGLDFYVNGSGEKGLLFIVDIFGPNAGRSKQVADYLAEAGYNVVMPDLTKGDWMDFPFEMDSLEAIRSTPNGRL